MYSIPSMNIRYRRGDQEIELNINEQRDDYNIVYTAIGVSEDTQIAGEKDETYGEEVAHGFYITSEDGSVVSALKSSLDKDIKDQDGNTLSITFDEVSIHQSMFVRWEKDGKTYELLGTDLNMSADELFDMAEEILAAN